MSDVILEAEMVAFSDITEGIDGKLCSRFPYSSFAKLLFRVLENSEFGREHRCGSEAQSP